MQASIAKDTERTWKPAPSPHSNLREDQRPIWRLRAALRQANLRAKELVVHDYKSLVRRYYSELWNAWSVAALEELISPEIVFHGSIGTAVKGIGEFTQYVNKIRAAFPDFHNHIEELIAEGNKVAARLTYTGTHRGELFGSCGTGRKITYSGLAIFEFKEAKIVRGYVLGDTETLKRQLAAK